MDKKCFCSCISLRKTVFWIGIVEIVINGVLVLITSVAAGLAFKGKLLPLLSGENETKSPVFYHNGWVDPFFVVLTIFMILFLTSLLFAIGLIIGVQKSSRIYLKNWNRFKTFSMTTFFVLSMEYILIVRFSDLLFIFTVSFLFLINLYACFLVKSYRYSLRKLQSSFHPPEMQSLTSEFPAKSKSLSCT